jgi:hypothetical protein
MIVGYGSSLTSGAIAVMTLGNGASRDPDMVRA